MLEKMAEEAIPIGVLQNPTGRSNPPPAKRKRNLPGNPDPEAEVVALSPKTLMATNRFLCEICGKGFQRDQNLQLHRRGHNLPWKLKQRSTAKEIARKKVYVCPEKSCVHHHPSRALGDLTGIKKHFCRKHGEKKWKCDKCSKRYAVQSDWKAHSKTCGTREYKCDCGTVFSRRDSFMTHRAFCDALAEETARVTAASNHNNINYHFIGSSTPPLVLGPAMAHHQQHFSSTIFNPISTNEEAIDPISKRQLSPYWLSQGIDNNNNNNPQEIHQIVSCPNPQLNWVFGNKDNTGSDQLLSFASLYSNHQTSSRQTTSVNMSATALLQKAAQIGATTSTDSSFFLGSIHGLKNNNNDNNNQLQLDGNKLCGLYGTGPIAARLASDVESSSVNDLSTFGDQFQMYPSKRRNIQNEESRSAGGQTRDFLGVGVRSICHPSSVNGWM